MLVKAHDLIIINCLIESKNSKSKKGDNLVKVCLFDSEYNIQHFNLISSIKAEIL